jgi:hypothetical protein
MGGSTFYVVKSGKTAKEAFNAAVTEAQHESGHGGYSGTIAEKNSFTMIELPKGADPLAESERLIDEADPRVDDKWGPAGCFDLGPSTKTPGLNRYVFFGWASD